ncbi:NfeD family protein [Dethiobacter alkaliphilus]|uniref:NfeD family protein n=1 Tax=Dethiobacter alkaliphilus TaxID=427926 RepID=UPI0022264090|nr:nodulation protein NfeD [Dethiobacter alkaliphilus]MCW3489334.1 nodulation protein NfeD [Dethiobacter alkaliphilus]
MKNRTVALIMLLLFTGMSIFAVQPPAVSAEQETVYVIPIGGAVEQGLHRYLERSFREAEEAGAQAIILEINTPGGAVDAATQIRDLIYGADMPVYAYVRWSAISAGAYIALSADALYMAPGSNIGAAEIQDMSGAEIDEKTRSWWESEMRSVAERQGRDEQVAAAMASPEIAIEGLVAEGEILTLTTAEAERIDFTDGVFTTYSELYEHLGLADAAVERIPLSPAEELARLITHPAVATLLITIGLAALVMEVMTAGFGVAGLVSLLSFSLFFGGHIVAGLAGREVIFLFVIGVILMLVEAFVPNFGILGLSGIASLTASVVLSASTTGQGLRIMIMSVFLAGVIIALSFRMLQKTGLWSQIILQYAETKDLGYVGPSDLTHLLDKTGKAVTFLRPSGTAEIDGQRVDVVSEGGFIAQDTEVKVVKVEGTRVVVRPL